MKYLAIISIFIMACVQPKPIEQAISDTTVRDTLMYQSPEIKTKRLIKSTMPQRDSVMNEAVTISNDFYKQLKFKNYIMANKYMHPDAISVTSFAEWLKIYQNAVDKKGNLAYVSMVDYGVKCQLLGGNGLGDYAELVFDSQYKDGNMREKLIFFRKNRNYPLLILGYEYNERVDRITVSRILN